MLWTATPPERQLEYSRVGSSTWGPLPTETGRLLTSMLAMGPRAGSTTRPLKSWLNSTLISRLARPVP
eukprot:scaffold38452_cov20-Tisochrysis_lutea.AAC.1